NHDLFARKSAINLPEPPAAPARLRGEDIADKKALRKRRLPSTLAPWSLSNIFSDRQRHCLSASGRDSPSGSHAGGRFSRNRQPVLVGATAHALPGRAPTYRGHIGPK